jgi:hypothetical protein
MLPQIGLRAQASVRGKKRRCEWRQGWEWPQKGTKGTRGIRARPAERPHFLLAPGCATCGTFPGMKKIRLSGREIAVLRAIDFSLGAPGSEIMERTHIERGELIDIFNGLIEAGYVETNPPVERVGAESVAETMFEINPSYVQDLKEATRRS